MVSNKFKLIGISGVGRAGKDSFYRFASEFLETKGITYGRWAFADELKKALDPFIQKEFGFSAFTDETELKNKVRPLMVEYGKIRRNESRGQHWLNKIRETILAEEGPQVRFITDLRFAKYKETDELAFVKSNGGKVIHVERYHSNNLVVEPANQEEAANDPLIKWAADLRFQWYDWLESGEELGRKAVFEALEKNEGLWKSE